MTPQRLRHAFVSIAVLALLVYAARDIDWRTAACVLRRAAAAPLAAAVVVNVLSMGLKGVRWWLFLRRAGVSSLSLAIRGTIVGDGLNNLVIANGGDAARTLLVARAARVSRARVLATLALERIFDPVCYGILLLIGTFVVPLPPRLAHVRPIVAAALAVGAMLLVLLIRTPGAEHSAVLAGGGWRNAARDFRRSVSQLSTTRRFVMALVFSIGAWAFQIATFALVAQSAGIALPLSGTIAALILTNAGLVVRATPGNVGYFQFAYALATQQFGVATAPAVAAAVLIQLVQIVPVTLAAVLLGARLAARDAASVTSAQVR